MKLQKKRALILLATGCVIGAVYLVFVQNDSITPTSKYNENTSAANHSSTPPPRKDPTRTARQTNATTKKPLHDRFVNEWESATLSLQGNELKQAHLDIVTKAISQLRGIELAHFIDYVIASGEFDNFKTYLAAGCGGVFTQVKEEEAFAWFSSIKNVAAQSAMAYTIGLAYHGDQFESHYAKFSTLPGIQREMLIGHCFTLTDDPLLAFNTYIKLKPSSADYSDLKRLAAATSTNFEKVSALFPDDSRSVSFEVRNALISRWASLSPTDAANFVLSNPQTVSPKQIDAVIQSWMKSNPKDAINWVNSTPSGPYQDQGYRSLANQLKRTDPSQAWNLAKGVTNPQLREELLKTVHSEWIKIDPTAAEAARNAIAASDDH